MKGKLNRKLNYGSFVSIAQLTDIHLFAGIEQSLVGIETEASFQETLATVKKTIPQIDFLLLTGDLTQDGSANSYDRLRRSLDRFGIHSYCLAGNHDDLPIMKANLPSEYVHLSRAVDVGNAACVGKCVACAVFDAGDQRGFELRLVNGRLAVLASLNGVGQCAGGAAVAAAPGGAHARARHGEDADVGAAVQPIDCAIKGDGQGDGLIRAVARCARQRSQGCAGCGFAQGGQIVHGDGVVRCLSQVACQVCRV